MTSGKALAILHDEAGTKLCAVCVAALTQSLASSGELREAA